MPSAKPLIGALESLSKYAETLKPTIVELLNNNPGLNAYQIMRQADRGTGALTAVQKNAMLRKSAADEVIQKSDPLSGPGFIGYLAPNGKFESFGERAAADADYHHSMLVKDMNAYDAEGGLTFVRYGGEPVLTIKGSPAMDPYHTNSVSMLADLARKLIDEGVHPRTPFKVEDMGFTKTEAPYQNRNIGSIGDWAIRK